MAKSLYEKKEYKLADLIEKATHNASIFVPDLQRPYRWLPNQVILLVDSIFRGWPFGTLLTWTVKPEIVDNHVEGIPARSFYTLVSRCPEVAEKTATMRAANFATEDTMVLDGQQRLQSLILAFGDTDGICLYDSDWDKDKDSTSRARSRNGYTTAGLCLDLGKYLEEMQRCNHRCRNVDLSTCLRWAVVDSKLCSLSHRGGKLPVPMANSTEGVFIPLKAMWGSTNPTQDEDEDLGPLAKQFLRGAFRADQDLQQFCSHHGGCGDVEKDVIAFLRRCCEIKELGITCLNVTAYSEPSVGTPDEKLKAKQEYDDAIVNIFTRLNTAGRALTREEITFAWVKSTWKDVGVTGDVYQKAEEFVARIRTIFGSWNLSDDAVIRALSILWCDHDADRQGRPLEKRELLQANVIRNMARFLRTNACAIVAAAENICRMHEDGHLRNVTDSFNDVAIAWDMYFTGETARIRVMNGRSEHDKDNAKKTLERDIIQFFINRWVALPTWGKHWADQAAAFLGQTMSAMAAGIQQVEAAGDENAWGNSLKALSRTLNDNAVAGARLQLRLCLLERKVYLYRSRLEIWQGLEETRAKFRSLTFRDANSGNEIALNVDHIVAYAAWKERIENEFAANKLTIDQAATVLLGMTDQDIAQKRAAGAQGFESQVKREAVEFINNIGNCMVLNAGYNIAKRKKPLIEFMDQMYEFQPNTPAPNRVDRTEWMQAMKLNDILINPNSHTIAEIADAIRAREAEIYGELEQFIGNPEPVMY